jgi:hypothetical protein
VFLWIPGVDHQAVKEGGDERQIFGELLKYSGAILLQWHKVSVALGI